MLGAAKKKERRRRSEDVTCGVAALRQILHFGVTQNAVEEEWLAGWIPQYLIILARAPVAPPAT